MNTIFHMHLKVILLVCGLIACRSEQIAGPSLLPCWQCPTRSDENILTYFPLNQSKSEKLLKSYENESLAVIQEIAKEGLKPTSQEPFLTERLLKAANELGKNLQDAIAHMPSVTLTSLTFNVGLLEWPLSFFPVKFVPGKKERFASLKEQLGKGRLNADVIFLQEVWSLQDARELSSLLDSEHFSFLGSTRFHSSHGLMIFYKKDRFEPARELMEKEFDAQVTLEKRFHFLRSFLGVKTRDKLLGKDAYFFNFHLTAFPENSSVRIKQAQELGKVVSSLKNFDGYSIIAGDTNASPHYYREASEFTNWNLNTYTYPQLISSTGALDTYAALFGSLEMSARWIQPGDYGYWKTQSLDNLLTRMSESTLLEPDQRIDMILAKWSASVKLCVDKAEVRPLGRTTLFETKSIELSDHYPYYTELKIGPPHLID